MVYKISILPTAQQDISNALDYISTVLQNPQASNSLLDKIYSNFKQISLSPYICAELNVDISLRYSYRKLHIDNYIAFYTVDEKDKNIYVIRFLYGKSDYIKQLNI